MWTLKIRIGPPELFVVASVGVLAAVVAVAFLSEWMMALVPGVTYGVAVAGAYLLYRAYLRERVVRRERPPEEASFRVVATRGACPLGYGKGSVVTVSAAGDLSPELCAAAVAALRLASGAVEPVDEWCCPVYDHMLVFRRELQAA